ncbi:class I SAM-dependent methyltransferase [Streptomyces umbrinus]
MTSSATGQQWASWLTGERDAQASASGKVRTASVLEEIRDRVLAGARLRPGDCVVDLGSGTGLLANTATRLVGAEGSVVAVDLSAPALSRIDVPVVRTAGTLTQLPLRDGIADAVVARSVLIYIDDLETAVSEAARILRPGGRFSAFEPVNSRRDHDAELTGFTKQQLAELAQAQVAASNTVRAMHAFTPERLQRALADAGLEDITVVVEPHRQLLDTEESAMGYLQQRGHASASTVLDQVTALWGSRVARRYEVTWREAFRRHGVITFTTPVLYAVGAKL